MERETGRSRGGPCLAPLVSPRASSHVTRLARQGPAGQLHGGEGSVPHALGLSAWRTHRHPAVTRVPGLPWATRWRDALEGGHACRRRPCPVPVPVPGRQAGGAHTWQNRFSGGPGRGASVSAGGDPRCRLLGLCRRVLAARWPGRGAPKLGVTWAQARRERSRDPGEGVGREAGTRACLRGPRVAGRGRRALGDTADGTQAPKDTRPGNGRAMRRGTPTAAPRGSQSLPEQVA